MLRLSLAFFIASSWIFAQTPTATLVGRVTDPSGAAIPSAELRVRNAVTNDVRQARTSATGEFTVPSLAPGRYDITVEITGFRTLRQEGLELQVDQVARVDLKLQVGAVSESIEVKAEAPLLNTENASKGEVITSGEITEMPLEGRDFQDLAFLVPGVYRRGENGQGSGMAVNGARADNTNFLLDGFSNQNTGQGGAQAKPPIDAMQEFKVQTSGYSAEYGRLAGGVMNMALKSGGNQLHGSLFEFLRNDKSDARNFFAVDKTKLRRNQFGATLNGPVFLPHLYDGRNRTFFLFSWESYRQIQGQSRLTRVPTELERMGDFSNTRDVNGAIIPLKDPYAKGACTAKDQSGCFPNNRIPASRFSPIANLLLPYFPIPNRPGQANNFRVDANKTDTWNSFLTKIDRRFSDRDSVAVRFLRRPGVAGDPFDGSDLGTFGTTTTSAQTMLGLTYTRMFTPVFINEFRVGFIRNAQNGLTRHQGQDIAGELGIPGILAEPAMKGFPRFAARDLAELGDANSNQNWTFNNYQWADTVTWVKARHLIKFGGDIVRAQNFQPSSTNVRGNFAFLGRWTNVPFGDMLMGLLDNAQRQAGTMSTYMFSTTSGLFVQDDFKVRPNLTLNFGLRYELMQPISEKYGRLTNFIPELGQVAIADDRTVPNLAQTLASLNLTGKVALAKDLGYPSSLVYPNHLNFAPRFGFAWRPFGGNRMAIRGGYGIFYAGFANASVRTKLSDIFPFSVSEYYGRKTNDPSAVTLSNPFPDKVLQSGGTVNANSFDLHPRPQYLQSWNLTVEREIGRGTALEIAYVGSKGTHLGRMYDINTPIRLAELRLPNGTFAKPYPGFNAISTHAFNSNSIYNAAMASVRRRLRGSAFFYLNYTFSKSIDDASQLFGSSNGGYPGAQDVRNLRSERARSDWDVGHAFTASFTYELPFRGNPFIRGWQLAGNARLYSGAPFTPRLSNVQLDQGEANRPDRIAKGNVSNPDSDQWFDLSAFPVVPIGSFRYGSSGRNVLDGPGHMAVNASLMKNWRFREYGSLQFRWESFNVTNHTNFNLPVTFVNAPNGATITRAANARTMQFALRYQF